MRSPGPARGNPPPSALTPESGIAHQPRPREESDIENGNKDSIVGGANLVESPAKVADDSDLTQKLNRPLDQVHFPTAVIKAGTKLENKTQSAKSRVLSPAVPSVKECAGSPPKSTASYAKTSIQTNVKLVVNSSLPPVKAVTLQTPQRKPNRPINSPQQQPVSKPRITLDVNSKVPHKTRQNVLNGISHEFHRIYAPILTLQPKLAHDHALIQEAKLHSAATKASYVGSALAVISRLKQRPTGMIVFGLNRAIILFLTSS